MITKYLISFCVFIVLLQNLVFAQYNEILVNRILDQRLIKQNIETISQDEDGFLWFGSGNGLLRYDGHDIRIFKHEINNPKSLRNNRIRTTFTDSEGNLWVTTQGGGLSLFNPLQENFINYFPIDDDTIQVNRESNNFDFWSLTEGQNNSLWIASFSGGGFYKFDKSNKTFRKFITPMSGIKHYSETSIVVETSKNELWVGTDESGIAVLDTLGNSINRFFNDPLNSKSLNSNSIKCILEDSKGRIWIGTRGGGLNLYSKSSQTFVRPKALKQSTIAVFNDIFSIYEDESGNLWLATDDGLLIYNPETDSILRHFYHEPFNDKSLATDRVRSIFKDVSGIFWIGNDGGGVHKLIARKRFFHAKVDPLKSDMLNANLIRSFLQVDESTLWVGTQGGGINVFDLVTGKVKKTMLHDPLKPETVGENEITTMKKNPKGGVWVGTWGGGLNLYNPKTKRFKHFRYNENDPKSISDDRVQSIHLDKNGNYWIGTENGLNVFDEENGTFERIQHDPNNSNSLSGNSIQTLAFIEDVNNVFWIGTWQGLNRYDRTTGTITRFQHDSENKNSLTADHVISLYDDGKGFLWIGTFSGGLNKLDKKTLQFESFSETDGLPNNVVFGILPGLNNTLWLSTNNGLSLFDTETKQFNNFNDDDGLQGNEFWWGSAYKAPDGRMFFGGTNGFTMFFPNEITVNNYIPPVIISSFTVFNNPMSIHDKKVIVLDYESNYFTIGFAALDFTNSAKNQYAYQLEGVDKSWIYSGNRNLVSYAFLNHGDYTFKVIGSNSNGVWNKDGTQLKIRILPPFWLETWFILIVIVVIVGISIGFFKIRTNQIKNQNKKLELLVNERTQELALRQKEVIKRNNELKIQAEKLQHQNEEIERQRDTILENSKDLELINSDLQELNQEKNYLMGIVAHDLRNPLATLKSFVDVLQSSPEISNDEREQILMIMDNSIDRQFDMISKILDTRAVETGNFKLSFETVELQSLIVKIVNQFKTKAQDKHLEICILHKVKEPILIHVDLHYLTQIIENLLSNAIKFSPQGMSVKISCDTDGNCARICVVDEGPGISIEDQKKLFGKYQRLSARPTAGESSTGLGLSIVKRFTEALNGKVWCDSELGKGATFVVELPTSQT